MMKKGSDLFDVSMSSCDGAEVCKLIDIFIEFVRTAVQSKSIGLYRDDGLSICKNLVVHK